MNNPTTKKQNKFDVAEYAEKVRGALKKLQEKQKPGVSSGVGTKTDVLTAAKEEIKALIEAGYTAKQVADAIGEDVFGILPKSITQLIGRKAPTKRVKNPQMNKAVKPKKLKPKGPQTPLVPPGATTNGPGTFTVKPDAKEL